MATSNAYMTEFFVIKFGLCYSMMCDKKYFKTVLVYRVDLSFVVLF